MSDSNRRSSMDTPQFYPSTITRVQWADAQAFNHSLTPVNGKVLHTVSELALTLGSGCHASTATIATKSGCSPRSVKNALPHLVKLGLLIRIGEQRKLSRYWPALDAIQSAISVHQSGAKSGAKLVQNLVQSSGEIAHPIAPDRGTRQIRNCTQIVEEEEYSNSNSSSFVPTPADDCWNNPPESFDAGYLRRAYRTFREYHRWDAVGGALSVYAGDWDRFLDDLISWQASAIRELDAAEEAEWKEWSVTHCQDCQSPITAGTRLCILCQARIELERRAERAEMEAAQAFQQAIRSENLHGWGYGPPAARSCPRCRSMHHDGGGTCLPCQEQIALAAIERAEAKRFILSPRVSSFIDTGPTAEERLEEMIEDAVAERRMEDEAVERLLLADAAA